MHESAGDYVPPGVTPQRRSPRPRLISSPARDTAGSPFLPGVTPCKGRIGFPPEPECWVLPGTASASAPILGSTGTGRAEGPGLRAGCPPGNWSRPSRTSLLPASHTADPPPSQQTRQMRCLQEDAVTGEGVLGSGAQQVAPLPGRGPLSPRPLCKAGGLL